MSVFVDTSALYAFLVGSEARHAEVRDAMLSALDAGRSPRTTSYVLVETHALLQHRIGMTPVRDLHRRLVPLLDVVWVDAELHQRAVSRLLREDRRGLSLVDVVSFEVMARDGIRQALTLDRHFTEAGFEVLPG